MWSVSDWHFQGHFMISLKIHSFGLQVAIKSLISFLLSTFNVSMVPLHKLSSANPNSLPTWCIESKVLSFSGLRKFSSVTVPGNHCVTALSLDLW